MITDKFNKDFSRGNKNISRLIEEIVADYFLKEKVTEDSLRILKQNVSQAVEHYRRNSQSGIHNLIQKRLHQKDLKLQIKIFKIVKTIKVKLHRNHRKSRKLQVLVDQIEVLKLAQLLLNQYTVFKMMMMINGQL